MNKRTTANEKPQDRGYNPSPRSPTQPGSADRFQKRRAQKQQKASDIFGDFFGFGPNPPGCMSKGAEPIDIKKEKERFMALLTQETKRYDVNGMTIDLNQKMDQIVTSIKKEEKIIMNDEERQLRNLDKLEYMSQYLNEDHIHTKDSLQAAQLIREDANEQMSEFELRNQQELKELEEEVRRINQQIDA